jgi:predicted nucleic acid-binding protein
VIILDTNVVSELMRSAPSPAVGKSLSKYLADDLHTTTITLAEVLYAIELLPAGKRKNELLSGAERLFKVALGRRLLPFDEPAAHKFSEIAAERRHRGRPIAEVDAQIAAIACLHGATIATRNTDDF